MAREAICFTKNVLKTLGLDGGDVFLESVQPSTNVDFRREASKFFGTSPTRGSAVVVLGETRC